MLYMYHSNDLDVLKALVARTVQSSPVDVFTAEAFLVQSQGMAHWLKLQLADELGVAASLDFPLPSSFVWRVFNLLKPELPQRSHFDKSIMAWKLTRLLPSLCEQPQCAAIRHYLEQDEQGIKCYQLAQKIADVFDQYLVYRPDWLLAWEKGQDHLDDVDVTTQPWQPYVWRALLADGLEHQHSLDHRARLLAQLPQLIREHPERLVTLPKRLFVFGIAALPGSYWQVLEAISSHIDVHFYLLNPCRNYWGDLLSDKQRLRILQKNAHAEQWLERGNPLLASWGQLGRDFLTLVHENEERSGLRDIEAFVDSDPKCLLHWLQQDILTLHDRQSAAFHPDALEHSRFKQTIVTQDDSIRVISAHSPLREVQRLYDQLLHWLDDDPTLKPRDIVVMVPNIDQYAPYIDAVFSSSSASTAEGIYQLPWAIADQAIVQENPLIESFLTLLALPDSRLTISDVQDWLDVPAIARRFDIEQDDLPRLRDWLAAANIRWGLDGSQRAQLGLPEFEQNSWRKGLRQLLLGFMLPDSQEAFLDDFPISAVEGNDGELLGKLMQFIDTLAHWQRVLAQPTLLVEQWIEHIQHLLQDFYCVSSDDEASLQRIRDALAQWQTDLAEAVYQEPISALVVRNWFNETLGQQGGWQRFLAGPVNVCTLMPMRSIPFKVVCLLGMNDSDYPRRVTPVGFDLMQSSPPRRGDRSRRDDDRYLFLEALCSAQKKLYLSYRGRDVRENAPLQPSVLVSELLDYLCDGFCLEGSDDQPHAQSRAQFEQWLIEALPLQPYHPSHFMKGAERSIISYQCIWARVAQEAKKAPEQGGINTSSAFVAAPLSLPDEVLSGAIQWADVKSALIKPLQFFIHRRLKTTLEVRWQEFSSEEPFALDALERHQLKQEYLQALLQSEPRDVAQLHRRQQALGTLPVFALGEAANAQLLQDSSSLVARVKPLLDRPLESRLMQIEINDLVVQGELQQAYEVDGAVQLVHYRAGQVRGQHLLALWLDLILASASQPDCIQTGHYFGLGEHYQFSAPTQQEALALIEDCLERYQHIWCQPVAHFPNALWQVLNSSKEPEVEFDSVLEAQFSELNSAYCERCFPEGILHGGISVSDWLAEQGALLRAMQAHRVSEPKEEQG